MKHITATYDITPYSSSILDFYFGGLKVGTLDIETTGLGAGRSKFILGGLYDIASGGFTQIFAEDTSEEAEALELYMGMVSEFDAVVTYNGRHFDIPYVKERYRRIFGHEYPERLPYDLDLFQVLNGHSPVKRFVPNLRQKTIEDYMGLWDSRRDEISGADSVDMYMTYIKTKDPELERFILLHNKDDVLQLARLMPITAKCDFHKAMSALGFPVGGHIVSGIRTRRDRLEISGIQGRDPFDFVAYQLDDQPVDLFWDAPGRYFKIGVPLIREKGLGIIDLFAAGLDPGEFEKYPACSSGFLVIEDHSKLDHMVTNHFVKAFMHRVLRYMGKE